MSTGIEILESRLKRISAESEAIDRRLSRQLAHQTKKLEEQRKQNPGIRFPAQTTVQYDRFLHTSNQFAIPVQNWKPGCPFTREKVGKRARANVHSAAATRNIDIALEDHEVEFVMSKRHEMASVELPLHGGVFEVVPTRKEPLHFERQCIWKEYL